MVVAIGIYALIMGISMAVIFSLFEVIGLIGGLLGIYVYDKEIIKLSNYKVGGFLGYLIFSFFGYSLLFSIFILAPILSGSYYRFDPWVLFFFGLVIFLSIVHITLILGLLTLFDYRSVLKNRYLAFTLSYFIASLLLTPLFTLFLIGIFLNFGTGFF